MDRLAIEELYGFTGYTWRIHADAIRALGENALTKPAPGSGWPALCDALSHIIFAYDRWLADPNGTTPGAMEAPVPRSWEGLEAQRRRVRARFREYLDTLSDSELMAPREMNVDGEVLSYSRAELLTHVLLHERAHHGDFSTLLYQLGVEAPLVEYRFFLPEREAHPRE